MGECRGSIDAVKRAEGELTEDKDDVRGLTNLTSADAQCTGQLHTHTHVPYLPRIASNVLNRHINLPGVIERWQLIQAQSLIEKNRHKQDMQQWQQLISDLQTMRAWLGQCEAELGQLRGLAHSTDIHTIQQRIKKLKVCRLCLL